MMKFFGHCARYPRNFWDTGGCLHGPPAQMKAICAGGHLCGPPAQKTSMLAGACVVGPDSFMLTGDNNVLQHGK